MQNSIHKNYRLFPVRRRYRYLTSYQPHKVEEDEDVATGDDDDWEELWEESWLEVVFPDDLAEEEDYEEVEERSEKQNSDD